MNLERWLGYIGLSTCAAGLVTIGTGLYADHTDMIKYGAYMAVPGAVLMTAVIYMSINNKKDKKSETNLEDRIKQ